MTPQTPTSAKLPMTRRGLTLFATLIVLTIGALVATVVLYASNADRASAVALERRTQARSLAWSGVLAAMQELADQRDRLIAGEDPTLTESWTLFEEANGVRGVVRLRSMGEQGAFASPEAARLDLNSIDAESLAKLPGVGEALADRIVAERPARGYDSVESLVIVEGVDPELLYGERLAAATSSRQSSTFNGDADAEGLGLVDLLTVFSVDPLVQSGVGVGGGEYVGAQCIDVGGEWTEEIEVRITDRFDQVVADRTRAWAEDQGISSRTDLVRGLRGLGVAPADWGAVLDSLTTRAGSLAGGRIDLNRAPAGVLATLPGLDLDIARDLTRTRDTLDEESLRSIAWPVAEGVLSASQFEAIVDRLTTRCLQWRVIVEGGVARSPNQDESIGGSVGEGVLGTDDPLESPMVLEAVIDLSEPTPRVAYLREVTLLPLAASMQDSGSAEPSLVADADSGIDPLPPDPALDPAVEPMTMDGEEGVGSEPEPGSGSAGREDQRPADSRRGRWTTGASDE